MDRLVDRMTHDSLRSVTGGPARTGRALNRPIGRLAVLPVLTSLTGLGCLDRTVTINTEPEGATVYLNDQDVGQSPVRVPFTWYGDYDIVIRKSGYETIRTNHRIDTPWYDLPGIDIVTECFMPFTVHDDRVLETYVMERQEHPTDEALLQAADEMRGRVQNPEG